MYYRALATMQENLDPDPFKASPLLIELSSLGFRVSFFPGCFEVCYGALAGLPGLLYGLDPCTHTLFTWPRSRHMIIGNLGRPQSIR